MNRHVGVELEFADINTYRAAQILNNHFGYNHDEWQDEIFRSIDTTSVFDYSKWNFVSDSSILNSNGTYSARSFIENGEVIKADNRIEEHRRKWSGIEVISPKTNSYFKLFENIENVMELMWRNGASVNKSLDTALHVHVDISDLSFEQLKEIPRRIEKIETDLQILSTNVLNPIHSLELVNRLESCSDIDEFCIEYHKVDGGNYFKSFKMTKNRRVINLSPFLFRSQENKTVEYRPFAMSTSVEYVCGCILLSLEITNLLIAGENMDFLSNRIQNLSKIFKETQLTENQLDSIKSAFIQESK
jgi:hypothetical protein